MRAIWTDENKLKIWLQIELLASEALVKEGVVPAKDFKKIKAGCDTWSADFPGLIARQPLVSLRSPVVVRAPPSLGHSPRLNGHSDQTSHSTTRC